MTDIVADAGEAVSAVIVQQGKVLDFVDGRTQRDETPEEYVRQEIAKSLVREYGYPRRDLRLLFAPAGSVPAPTCGRALDHTGIGVKDVKAFCEELAQKGVTCNFIFNGAIATITDPAGVTIEINSGLEKR